MAIYQVVVKATLAGTDEQRNVHWYDSPTGILSPAEEQSLVDNVDDEYKDNLQAFLSDQLVINGCDVRRVDLPNLPTLSYVPTNGPWAGLDVTDPLPPQVAALVTWKANTTFPRHARTYMFTTGESCNNGAAKTAGTFDTALLAFASDLLSITLAGGKVVSKVAARFEGSPPSVTAFNALSSYATQRVWATQRGRRFSVGV